MGLDGYWDVGDANANTVLLLTGRTETRELRKLDGPQNPAPRIILPLVDFSSRHVDSC